MNNRLDIDCDDAYGEPRCEEIPDWLYDQPLDTEACEAELARLDAIQEANFQRVKKLHRLIALYKLHDELINTVLADKEKQT